MWRRGIKYGFKREGVLAINGTTWRWIKDVFAEIEITRFWKWEKFAKFED